MNFLDRLPFNFSTYKAVNQLEIKDTTKTKVRMLWLVPNKGIVGLDIEGEIWEKR